MSEVFNSKQWSVNRDYFDRNLAVVIGIDHYKNKSIRDLSTAVSDARAIADLLEQEYAYKQSKEKPEVIRLFDKEATLEVLLDLFNTKMPEELKPGEGDRLIVYFAGHGLPRSNNDGPEGYLVPHDADPTEPTSFLAMRDISRALDKLECHHLLVILDCCFAGTFRWAGSRKAVPILETIRQEHYYHFIRHPAWQVITSSAHDQEALDVARLKEDNRQPAANKPDSPFANEPHSPFALALLEGLHPEDGSQRVKADLFSDGVVTAHELFVYLQTRVKQLSDERQAPGIYPMRRDYDKGEFVFTLPGFDHKKLAEALPLNEENNPYRGLKSFDEKHAGFFFGRQALIEELSQRLTQTNQVLTVVLGVSGSGKSSLVKAGLIPHLRDQKTQQKTDPWRILEPMRPGEAPFVSLARTLLPIAHENLLEQLAEASFRDDIFQPMSEPDTESDKISANETLIKLADSWCSAKPEAKLLLIEDYYTQLETLVNPQQRGKLKDLYDQILKKLGSVTEQLQIESYFSQLIAIWHQKYPDMRLLLVIDQFEELLTRSRDDRESSNQSDQQGNRSTDQKEWQKFLEVLRVAITNHSQTLRLVLTLRSDFEPRFLRSALEPYWKDARFPVRAMTSDELRQAIEDPALKQALYFEELKDDEGSTIGNLVSKLVDEVGQMPGALPLLSFALSELYVELYKRWKDPNYTGRTLLFEDYESLGGVAGALTRRATEEYDRLIIEDKNPNDEYRGGFGKEEGKAYQSTMQRVMLRMVAIEGEVTRRRVPEYELQYPDLEENKRVGKIVERLIHARLLVKGQETGEPYIEPAHDFLVRGWDKLQEWIKREQTNLILQRRLTPAALDWETNHEQDRLLWNASSNLDLLKQVLRSTTNCWFNRVEIKFVRSSVKRKRRNVTIRWLGVGALLAATTTAALFFNYLRQIADQRELIARQNLYASNINLVSQEWGKSQITQLMNLLDNSYPQVNQNDLRGFEWYYFWKLAHGDRFTLRHEQLITSVTISPDGKTLATVNSDMRRMSSENSIKLWELTTGEELPVVIPGHPDGTVSAALSPDGKILATGGLNDASVRLWDVATGKELQNYHAGTGYESGIGRHGTVHTVKFSPDGKLVALLIEPLNCVTEAEICTSVGLSPIVKVLNVATGEEKAVFSVIDFGDMSFSPDSKTLAVIDYVSSNTSVILWNLTTNQEQSKLDLADGNWARSLAFSPDGKTLVLGGDEVRTWDVVNRGTPQRVGRHRGNVAAVAFSSDGRTVASASLDRTIKLWDITTYRELTTIQGHTKAIRSIAFSSDNKTLVTGSDDGTAKVWDIEQAIQQSDSSGDSFTFSPDGRTLVTWDAGANFGRVVVGSESEVKLLDGATLQEFASLGYAGFDSAVVLSPDSQFLLTWNTSEIKLWNANTGQEIANPPQWIGEGDFDQIHSVTIAPNSQMLAVGSHQVIYLWRKDTEQWQQFSTISSGDTYIETITFSPDSKTLVAVNADRIVTVWNVATQEQQATFKLDDDAAQFWGEVSLEFSPDGKTLITGIPSDESLIKLWDTKTWRERASLNADFPIWKFSPNGEMIAITGNGGNAQLVNTATAETILTFEGHTAPILSLAFSPDGQRLVSGSQDGTVKIWNSATGIELLTLGANLGDVRSVAFSPDGKTLVASHWKDDERRIKFWRAATDEEIWISNLREADPQVFEEGQRLALEGNLNEAITRFQIILKDNPDQELDSVRVAQYFAVRKAFEDSQTLAKAWNFEGLVAKLRHALELAPNLALNPELDAQRIILLAHRSVVLKAEEHIIQGFDYREQGDLDKVTPELTKGIELLVPSVENGYSAPPRLLEAYIERGVRYFVQQQYNQAVVDWKAATQIVPSDPRAYGNLGFAYYELNQLDQAITAWKTTTELEPKYDEAWAGLGIALYEKGQVDEGIAMYRKALEIEPNFNDIDWLRKERSWSEKSLESVSNLLKSLPNNN